ncbi:MAG: hypothetical protein H6978_08865 [Gammaproteobacteria bacterium]|nr:hypothetical protein [Gammaproteobacteria bacterium]
MADINTATRTTLLPQTLEQWYRNPRPMRAMETAEVESYTVARDIHYIDIRHGLLERIDRQMLAWWHRYFCYQRLVASNGMEVSGFELWHPEDHVSCVVERHSLSGALGLTDGARFTCVEKHGNGQLTTRSGRVLRLDDRGRRIDFRIFQHIYGLQMDDVVESGQGISLSTRMVLETKGFVREATERGNEAVIDELKTAWIRHTIEEIGNLERILPCMYHGRQQGRIGQQPHASTH